MVPRPMSEKFRCAVAAYCGLSRAVATIFREAEATMPKGEIVQGHAPKAQKGFSYDQQHIK